MDRLPEMIMTGVGAIVVGVILSTGLNLSPIETGILSGGLYWLNCN